MVYPNPSNTETRISIELLNSSKVTLDIYDKNGNYINNLIFGSTIQNGKYEVIWDGIDQRGNKCPVGNYFTNWRMKRYHCIWKNYSHLINKLYESQNIFSILFYLFIGSSILDIHIMIIIQQYSENGFYFHLKRQWKPHFYLTKIVKFI